MWPDGQVALTIDEVFAAGCVVESAESRVISGVNTQEQLVSSKGVTDLTFTDGQVPAFL